jgi:hypothetical protein
MINGCIFLSACLSWGVDRGMEDEALQFLVLLARIMIPGSGVNCHAALVYFMTI